MWPTVRLDERIPSLTVVLAGSGRLGRSVGRVRGGRDEEVIRVTKSVRKRRVWII